MKREENELSNNNQCRPQQTLLLTFKETSCFKFSGEHLKST